MTTVIIDHPDSTPAWNHLIELVIKLQEQLDTGFTTARGRWFATALADGGPGLFTLSFKGTEYTLDALERTLKERGLTWIPKSRVETVTKQHRLSYPNCDDLRCPHEVAYEHVTQLPNAPLTSSAAVLLVHTMYDSPGDRAFVGLIHIRRPQHTLVIV